MSNLITIKKAKEVIGGLGKSSKMPCFTYGSSAFDCKVGSKLAKIPNTPCFDCYAAKGNYLYPNVSKAHANRKYKYRDPKFVLAFVKLLEKEKYFRWKDSGDLEDMEELQAIVKIAKQTPHVKHWLPTQERGLIRAYKGKFPDNLIIRVSSTKVGQLQPNWANTSMVLDGDTIPQGVMECKAPFQNNQCKECRACWNKDVKHIGYHKR